MNFGDCPYDGCTGFFFLPVPDRTPAYRKVTCETCGRDVWYEFSRLDPKAWIAADFEAAHDIDVENRRITPKCQKTT